VTLRCIVAAFCLLLHRLAPANTPPQLKRDPLAAHVLTQITHDHMQSHPTRLMILVAAQSIGTGDDRPVGRERGRDGGLRHALFRAGHVRSWVSGSACRREVGGLRADWRRAFEEVFHPLPSGSWNGVTPCCRGWSIGGGGSLVAVARLGSSVYTLYGRCPVGNLRGLTVRYGAA